MKIGVVLPSVDHGTIENLIESVQSAADAELDSVWLTHSTGFDALTALAVVAREVPDIDVGTAVTPVYSAHPSRLAAQARTTNAAVGGRLILGIGVSHRAAIEGRLGLTYESPAAYMREYLSILRPLVQGEKVDFNGEFLASHLRLTDKGNGELPILLAALQPRMLSLAGELADGTITWCCGVKTVRSRIVPALRSAAEQHSRADPAIVVALPVCVTSDEVAGHAMADKQLEGYEKLPVYRAILDEEGAKTPGDVAIVGTEDQVLRQLQELAEAGCTTLAAIGCGDEATRKRTVALLSKAAHSAT
jgi:5,10-methylenetetrahydromethanopterin reductase